jgi:phosphoserine phosphatase RsbU/P
MRFRTVILLWMLGLVSLVLTGAIAAVTTVIDRAARRDLAADLVRTQQVFGDLQAYRQTLLRSETRVVAEEPRLKAVVATEDISHETVVGVVQDLTQALRCDLLVLTDGSGRLLADVSDASASGDDLSRLPLVAEALDKGESSGIWTDAKSVYQVQGHRLNFGESVVGVVVLGYRWDDKTADTVQRQTASGVVVTLDGKPVASSSLEDGDRASVGEALAGVPPSASVPSEVHLGGATDLALTATLAGYQGDHAVRYAVIRSLDRALAPRHRLVLLLWGLLGASIACAAALSLGLARRLSRPIDGLVDFTRRIAAGDLRGKTGTDGPIEIQTLGTAMNRMVTELAESREHMAIKQRLERDLEIAVRIQTSILPRDLDVPGLEIAAAMLPASEVGGDYYDVLPVADGCWIGIGDVAGHGLTAGLAMMMVQSIVSALVARNPDASPVEAVRILNEVLYDNIRRRLKQDEHVTLSLLRYTDDGRVVFAGAHEDIVIVRAGTKQVELVRTPGTWLGVTRGIEAVTVETTLQLRAGDLMVLYTDGMLEERNADNERFEYRFFNAVVDVANEPVEKIRDHLMGKVRKWMALQEDDCTVVVLRYRGKAAHAE